MVLGTALPLSENNISLPGIVCRPLSGAAGVDIATVTGPGELPGPVRTFLACQGPLG